MNDAAQPVTKGVDVEWFLQRKPTRKDWMFGTWTCGAPGSDAYSCHTLEDERREVKVRRETAIPAGRYRLTYEMSPRFQKSLLTLVDVPGFDGIRVHSVRSDDDTEGCIGVGSVVDELRGRIGGGLSDHVKEKLEMLWIAEYRKGNTVYLNVLDAPGDKFADTGRPVPAPVVADAGEPPAAAAAA